MARGNNHKKYSLKVTDFSDGELLAIARDIQYNDGQIDITQVALTIWPNSKRNADDLWHARHCVAIRFAHMKNRMGVLNKIPGQIGIWELTALGEAVLNSKISAAQERAILEAHDEQGLSLMSLMGDLYESVNEPLANLMRREFQFRAHRRRWG